MLSYDKYKVYHFTIFIQVLIQLFLLLLGHYMFLDAYDHATRHSSSTTSTARFISPEFPSSHGYCILFWYNLHGADVKELNVYAKVWDVYYFDFLKVNYISMLQKLYIVCTLHVLCMRAFICYIYHNQLEVQLYVQCNVVYIFIITFHIYIRFGKQSTPKIM